MNRSFTANGRFFNERRPCYGQLEYTEDRGKRLMITESNTWRDYITIPVLIALAGSILFFAATFFEIGRLSVFGYVLPFRLEELGLSREVALSRILSAIGAGLLLIPKIGRVSYAACGLGQFILFGPKVIRVLRHISSALNIAQAVGISNLINLEDYISHSAGYYLMLAGAVIVFGCSVYFFISMFQKRDKAEPHD